VKALSLIPTLGAQETGIAEVAWLEQPDTCQSNSRLYREAPNDLVKDSLDVLLTSDGYSKRE
jgi:hypothetical protein